MLTLLTKAFNDWWRGSQSQNYKVNQNVITKNDELVSETSISEDEKKLDLCGHVTSINKEGGYGLINDGIYFNVDSVVGGRNISVGDQVFVTAFKQSKGDGWRATDVYLSQEMWENKVCLADTTNSIPALSNVVNKETETNVRDFEIHAALSKNAEKCDSSGEKKMIGMITEINEDFMVLNNSYRLLTEDSELCFKPVVGDWIVATYIQDEALIAKCIKPLREDILEGKISSLRSETGIINWKAYFHVSVCRENYCPRQWDEVTAKVIESRQESGKFHWRALSVTPKRFGNTTKWPELRSLPLNSEFIQNILADKEGVSISSPLDFGKIAVGETKYITVWIRNDGKTDQTLLKYTLQTSASEESQFNLGKIHLYSWSKGETEVADGDSATILSGGSAYLNISCDARNLGKQSQLAIFKFKNFAIGRYILINVYDPAQDTIAPIAPYRKQNHLQHLKKIRSDKKGSLIPGPRPWLPIKSFAVRLPPYQVPKDLWELVSNAENLTIHMPVLTEELSIDNYVSRFTTLLHLEEIQMHILMREMDMVETCLRPHGTYLALMVPGLSEGRPSLLVGDKVILTPPSDVEQGPRYEGWVHEVLQNEVLLKFHDTFHQYYGGETYDVEFHFNRTPLRRCHYAVSLAPKLPEEVLFPTQLHIKTPLVHFISEDLDLSFIDNFANEYGTTADNVQKSNCIIPDNIVLKWLNRSLNERQKAAVSRIISGMCRPLPYIIFGPPGTGKTITMVEAILQVFIRLPSSRIMVCTPSNSAADLLTQRIHESGIISETDMVRLNAFQRVDQAIPDSIKPYCKDGEHLEVIAYHRIIVSTCHTAGTFYSLGLNTTHFTHVFIDEAGQATEPEILIAACLSAMGEGQVILAGDPMQLGPILQSSKAKMFGLETSYLERIMQMPLYLRDPEKFAKYGDYNPFLVTKLIINYRSHPAILELSSKIFYNDDLKYSASKNIQEMFCEWSCLPKSGFPILFHGIQGEDLQEGNSPSWFNPAEAVQIIRYLQDLYDRDVEADKIGIITPYKKQVEKIRILISSFGLNMCKVGSVEEFQGQEKPVIILSTVRSSQDMVQFDVRHNLGFLSSPKRFNVAITRAQSLLIIIGDPFLLQKDPFWGALIDYCLINECYTGCDFKENIEIAVEE